MSERISIVVPDGTREKLKQQAKEQKRTQSNLSRKFILDGLNNGVSVGDHHVCIPVKISGWIDVGIKLPNGETVTVMSKDAGYNYLIDLLDSNGIIVRGRK